MNLFLLGRFNIVMAAVLSFMLGALSISGILVKLFLVVVDILLGRI